MVVGEPNPCGVFALDVPEFEIFKAIVVSLSILVMNSLVRLKNSAKCCFHNYAMFHNPLAVMFDEHIAIYVGSARAFCLHMPTVISNVTD